MKSLVKLTAFFVIGMSVIHTTSSASSTTVTVENKTNYPLAFEELYQSKIKHLAIIPAHQTEPVKLKVKYSTSYQFKAHDKTSGTLRINQMRGKKVTCSMQRKKTFGKVHHTLVAKIH